ncbi:MAG TPA: SGNH/GDSL hydrolase family protein [Steroidobacteraceae bacterium]|nr:SGNH/GDSL hydrolase family protein [Steroidobacteraceae bacterium]
MSASRAVWVLSVLSAVAAALGAAPAGAEEHAQGLALGDSVVFGYISAAGHQYVNPTNFIGSPEYLSGALHLEMTNAGCPGETSGSLLSAAAPDHGCRDFKSTFPLHVSYGSTQLAYALRFLTQHRDTRLVTIGVGANDLFVLEDSCAADPNPTGCLQAGLPAVLNEVGMNLGTLLAELRATGYGGAIVVVNYYALDYTDPLGTQATAALNQALAAPAKPFGAVIADVFSAFKRIAASPDAAGKTCNTGLLNVDPQDQTLCDVHPSQSGQRLIARTIAEAYRPVR